MHLAIVGDWAVGSGWLARAQTLLGEAVDSPERGWVALNIGMFEADRARKDEHFRDALEPVAAPATLISSSSRWPTSAPASCTAIDARRA